MYAAAAKCRTDTALTLTSFNSSKQSSIFLETFYLPPYLWILTFSLVAASYLQINPWTQLLSLFRICYKAKNIMTTETFKVFMYLIFIYRNIYLLKAIITIYIEKLKNLINIKKKRVIPFKYKKKQKKN